MVRRWWSLALLAVSACYQPSELCGDNCDAAVDDSVTTDADTDAPMDGVQPVVTCVDAPFNGATLVGVTGTSYSRNVSDLAWFLDSNGKPSQITTPGTMPNQVVFTPNPVSQLDQPVLASSINANGDLHAFFVTGNNTFQRSTFVNGVTWTSPITITTEGVVVDSSFVFGQPTVTNPRHSFASSNSVVYEAVEEVPNTTWSFSPVLIPGHSFVNHPSLSFDGLALVFVGTDINGTVQLYLAERSSITVPFTTSIALLDQPANVNGTERYPRFGPDCDHIFLSTDDTVIDLH